MTGQARAALAVVGIVLTVSGCSLMVGIRQKDRTIRSLRELEGVLRAEVDFLCMYEGPVIDSYQSGYEHCQRWLREDGKVTINIDGYRQELDLHLLAYRPDVDPVFGWYRHREFEALQSHVRDLRHNIEARSISFRRLVVNFEEYTSYSTWSNTIERILLTRNTVRADMPYSPAVVTNKVIVWDFTQNFPTGICHRAFRDLPLSIHAHSPADNPLVFAVEQAESVTTGYYVREGSTGPLSKMPASRERVRVSVYDGHDGSYIGATYVEAKPLPNRVSVPSNQYGGLGTRVADSDIAQVVMQYRRANKTSGGDGQ